MSAAPLRPRVRTEERDADPPRCEECVGAHGAAPLSHVWSRPCDGCDDGHRLCGPCARDLGMEEAESPWAWPHCPDAARLAIELAGRTRELEDAKAVRILTRFGGHPRDAHTQDTILREAVAAGLPARRVSWRPGGLPNIEMRDGRAVYPDF